MKPGLQLRTAQGLALTPQLQQSIRLLQLSTQELQQELQQALAENPFLELAEESQRAELAETRQLLALAVEEAVQVARAAGVRLPYENPLDKVLAVAVATGQNQSSMLQDVLRGSPTEIAVINGAIVREGERLGVATPVNRTLTLLVQALEKNLFPS